MRCGVIGGRVLSMLRESEDVDDEETCCSRPIKVTFANNPVPHAAPLCRQLQGRL